MRSTSRKKKQKNIRQGISIITALAYLLFETQIHQIRKIETFKILHLYRKTIIEIIKSNIFNDAGLSHNWLILFTENTTALVSENEDPLLHLTELFNEIIPRFINVSASYFRKDN